MIDAAGNLVLPGFAGRIRSIGRAGPGDMPLMLRIEITADEEAQLLAALNQSTGDDHGHSDTQRTPPAPADRRRAE